MSDSNFDHNPINGINTPDGDDFGNETEELNADEFADVAAEVVETEPVNETEEIEAEAFYAQEAEAEPVGEVYSEKPRKPIKKSRISYERKKGLYGYAFVALWIVGTIYMFIIPMFMSLYYSCCDTDLIGDKTAYLEKGMSGPGVYAEWNNFQNYKNAFTSDQKYPVALVNSLTSIAPKAALILVFSLFIAVLLSQKFKGRTVMRAIFFLPVLIATGPVISVINGDIASTGIADASQFSTLFKADFIEDFLSFLGLRNISAEFTENIKTWTSDIFNLIWNSGIQILIFLSALQQIPQSAKEAASMEGATGWEFFWKITFPTISPMILVNLIYTVIDAFVDTENEVMKLVISQSQLWEHGYSACLAWIYFAIIGAALGLIVAIVSRFVFYQVD